MSKLRPYQLAAFKHMVAQMEQQELAAYITDVVEHSSDDVVDAVYGMFCTDSSLPRTVDLFTKVNEDCAKSIKKPMMMLVSVP